MRLRRLLRLTLFLVCLSLVVAPAAAQEPDQRLFLPEIGAGPSLPTAAGPVALSSSVYLPLVSHSQQRPEDTRQSVHSALANAGVPLITWEYDEEAPAVAYGVEAGQHMVAWEDHYAGGVGDTDADIYARRVSVAGEVVGDKFAVADAGAARRLAPDIAYGPAQFLVVWEHVTTDANHDIYARRVSSAGAPVGDEFTVSANEKSEKIPAVAYNAINSTYLVVWEHHHAAGDIDIRAQRLNSDGGLLNTYNIDVSTNEQMSPDVACSATDGRCLIVWSGKPDSDGSFGIYGMTLSSDGLTQSARIAIETWSGDQVTPSVAWNPLTNKFLVVWADGYWDWWNTTLYGEILSTDGATVHDLTITSTLDGRCEEPQVAYASAAHGWLVVWEQEESLGNHDIYRRLYSGGGSPLENAQVVAAESHSEESPAVIAGQTSQALVVWQDTRDAASKGIDLYMTAAALPMTTFSGHVYEGAAGETDNPLPNVVVTLSCSNDEGDLGSELSSTTTNKDGTYALIAYEVCEFYHIVETDPPNFFSVNSDSPSGEVVDPNYIRYALPLTGKQLDANNFWDMPVTPDDVIAPAGWAYFKPTTWQGSHTVPVQAQVQDTQSGLDVATARYAISTDGGATWGAWQPAACSGSSGATTPQILSADAAFGQDSGAGNLNRVKFHISDRDGNEGTSPVYAVKVDTVQPANPTSGSCSPHQPNVWSKVSPITCTWTGAGDASSGIGGYGYVWDHSAATVPPAAIGISDPKIENWPLADHNAWYLHVRALDVAGNAANSALHLGPYKIDATPPQSAVNSGPSKVNSTTFAVSWSGTDATSGLLNYDVQVRNVTYDGKWTNWQTALSLTSSTFTGVDGFLYDFRSRAWDKAGNVEQWPDVADRRVGIATMNFQPLQPSLEVTQAVQDMNNSVALVEDKVTYVRFHVRTTAGSGFVTAELKGSRGATLLGTLAPANPSQIIDMKINPQRSQLGQSFYFLLPPDWRKGTVSLQAQVNPDHRLIESDYTDNYATTTVTFQSSPPLLVVFVPITYTMNSTVRTVRTGAVNDIRGHLRKMYPIGALTSSVHATTVGFNGTTAQLCNGAAYPTILASLKSLRASSGTTLGGNTLYYGTVPADYESSCTSGYVTGMADDIPSTVAAGIVPVDVEFTGNNAAHELGHCLGRGHSNCCGAAGGPKYPYPSCDISPNSTTYFGFDVTDVEVHPTTDQDLMSYCWNNMWISDYTYKALRSEIVKYPTALQAAAPGDVLLISALWNRTRGETTLNPFYRLSGLAATAPVNGGCRVKLLNAGGAKLAEHAFAPGKDTQPMPGKDEILVLHTLVPDHPDVRRVDIYCDNELLASRSAGAHAPTVQVTSPNGGERWQSGQQTIRWQANDADALRFLIQYSTDNGATWTSLAVDVAGRSYSFDAGLLTGSTKARIRVVVTDGLLTAADTSDAAFSVANKPPQVSIDFPSDGARFDLGQTVLLTGYAWDAEDGVLPGSALSWRSDVGGALGTGKELATAALAAGRHRITLGAADGDGLQGAATVEITIAVPQTDQRVHLPVVVRE